MLILLSSEEIGFSLSLGSTPFFDLAVAVEEEKYMQKNPPAYQQPKEKKPRVKYNLDCSHLSEGGDQSPRGSA